METGAIPLETIPGPVNLQATLESGQTFGWTRPDGRTYAEPAPSGGDAWYRTVVGEGGAATAVAVRQTDGAIEWRCPDGDPTDQLRRRLRLDGEMAEMIGSLPAEPPVEAAVVAFPGLRVVAEPFFPTLVSFVLSAQMRVERIHLLVGRLAERYGRALPFGDGVVHTFPEPAALAAVTEADLREMGLGYRAPYVRETARMVAEGDLTLGDVEGLPYEDARERLTGFVGVGEKVADCVLLFSLGYTEPVPLDTWIRRAIDETFPELVGGNYAETSAGIRERLGPYPGIAQTYLFHYLRHRETLATAGRTGT